MPESEVSRVSLDEIGIRYGTDKSSKHHGYLEIYEQYLSSFRDKPIKVLEIGVLDGASLRLWAEYFSRAKIIGLDIMPKEKSLITDRVLLEIADQSDIEDLTKIALRHGPFDLIIEDGSHLWEHQITTFKTLFPFINKGGIYIAEDLQTNFGALGSKFRGNSSISFVDYAKKIIDLSVSGDESAIRNVEDPFLRSFALSLQQIVLFKGGCLFKKNEFQRSTFSRFDAAIVPSLSDMHPTIVAHIANVGDVVTRSGSVVCGEASAYIQGFAIWSNPEDGITISYRARLADNTWSSWAQEGEFVGTRGLSRPVTGISVRTKSTADRQIETQCYALYQGDESIFFASDGADCVAGQQSHPLRAFQLILK